MRYVVQTRAAVRDELLTFAEAAHHITQQFNAAISLLARQLFDPYRPELHYMRGPGPKWREKHGLPRRDR